MNKNKILLAAAVATAGLVAVPAAFAQDATNPTSQQGWYVAANAGYAGIDKGPYDNGAVAGGVTGGYRFAINPATSLGLEVGYQYLGQISARGLSSDSSANSKLRGTTAGLDLRYNLSPSWYGELRGGAWREEGRGIERAGLQGRPCRIGQRVLPAGVVESEAAHLETVAAERRAKIECQVDT